jgi:hypothetical protein
MAAMQDIGVLRFSGCVRDSRVKGDAAMKTMRLMLSGLTGPDKNFRNETDTV